jgi:glycosyltransferase involved in cell wall biosynthesis
MAARGALRYPLALDVGSHPLTQAKEGTPARGAEVAPNDGGQRGVTTSDAPFIAFCGLDWWYHSRAHSDFQLMTRLARTRKVLLVNSIGMRMPLPGRSTMFLRRILRKAKSTARFLRRPRPDLPNLWVMTPLVVPFYGVESVRRWNARSIRAQVASAARWAGIRDPHLFVTIPTAWDVVRTMPRRSLTFNRSDKHSAFGEADRGYIEALEHDLLTRSDHVVYSSHALMDEERERTGERAAFLDHGVDVERFRRVGPEAWPADLRAIPGPRIGFFGTFDDYVIDFGLLETVARRLPRAQLVLIGDSTCSMKRFERYPNVHWLGVKPYETIPAYGSGFDVALMPWLQNDWIRYCNPIKLKEYLALGLPIVSTDFPEAAWYRERMTIARGADEFVAAVERALAEPAGDGAERRRVVEHATWENRAAELLRLCEGG